MSQGNLIEFRPLLYELGRTLCLRELEVPVWCFLASSPAMASKPCFAVALLGGSRVNEPCLLVGSLRACQKQRIKWRSLRFPEAKSHTE